MFPSHYNRDKDFNIIKEIPPVGNRRTFFYIEFGNVLYISLDSGYIMEFKGWQVILKFKL